MESLLLQHYGGESVGKKHSGCKLLSTWREETKHCIDEDWEILTGVRNPYDSLVSAWLKLKTNHKNRKAVNSVKKAQSGELTFRQYNYRDDQVKPKIKEHWSRECRKLKACVTEFIRFESMQEDWMRFCEKKSIPRFRIPQVNTTQKLESEKLWRSFYDQALVDDLYPYLAEYMELTGYEKPQLNTL